jgi:glycosyltransferase involved in cell wall biosynthesis
MRGGLKSKMSINDIAKVSVIVPVYNAAPFLRQCLDSIVRQTLRDIEIICVNDGSTDDSLGILEEYAANDKRLRVMSKENEGKGAASARNLGLESAKGKYLSFLDSDDFFELAMLEQMVNRAEETGADIVLCNGMEYDHQTGTTYKVEHILSSALLPDKPVFSYKDCAGKIYQLSQGAAWNKLFRRTFLEKHDLRFQRINYTDDAYFAFSHMILAEKISAMDECLLYYRVNTKSNQSASVTRYPESAYLPYLALKTSLIEWGVYEEVKQSLINCALTFVRHCYDKVNTFAAFRFLHDKCRNEIFCEFDVANRQREYFYDERLYSWCRQIIENSAEELTFKAARSYGLELTTGVLRFQFPYDSIERDSRIVLFGAGIIGRYYYSQIILSSYCDIVLWVDSTIVKKFSYLHEPQRIREVDYDAIVISYGGKKLISKTITYLLEIGVPAEKIIHQ